MKKIVIMLAMFLLAISSFAQYSVGDVCDDISWTDNEGLETSIYDQVSQGKAVMLFWGNTG